VVVCPRASGERVSHGLGDVREATQERGYTLILLRASPSLIHGKSRMRRRARTDLCGGRSVMAVPTATVGQESGQNLCSFGGRYSSEHPRSSLVVCFLEIDHISKAPAAIGDTARGVNLDISLQQH